MLKWSCSIFEMRLICLITVGSISQNFLSITPSSKLPLYPKHWYPECYFLHSAGYALRWTGTWGEGEFKRDTHRNNSVQSMKGSYCTSFHNERFLVVLLCVIPGHLWWLQPCLHCIYIYIYIQFALGHGKVLKSMPGWYTCRQHCSAWLLMYSSMLPQYFCKVCCTWVTF